MNRKGLGQGKGSGYYNIIPTYDSHIHSLSARGMKSCLQKNIKVKLNAKTYSYKLFSLDNEYSISCHTEDTRTGFRHIAVLLRNGVEVDRDKSVYYNRTWESYEYESVIHSLLTKHFPEVQAKVFIAKADGKPIRTDLAGNVYAKGKLNVPDIDEIYSGGFKTNDKKDDTGQFEKIEVWQYEGKEFFIGRNYKEGESILLDVQTLHAKGKKLDAMTFDLAPRYDGRKSFYGKARVEQTDDGRLVLYSYNTKVAEIVNGVPIVYDTYSPTTLRHIKEFLKQQGFKAETGKQIMKDYNKPQRRDLAGNLYAKIKEIPLSLIKEKIDAESLSRKEGIFTAKLGYYYSKGRTTEDFVKRIKKEFPNAEIIDSGDIYKPQWSYWYVKFKLI